jgi:hypothetical protein
MKKLMNTAIKIAVSIFLLGMIFGCSTDSTDAVETYAWIVNSSGFLEFYTNDSSLSLVQGHLNNNVKAPLTEVTVLLNKVSTSTTTKYGFLFCYDSTTRNYYRILINANGNYEVVKIFNNSYYFYNGSAWSTTEANLTSTDLLKGLNVVNAVNVKINSTGFVIQFNGGSLITVTDNSSVGTVYISGDTGFITYVDGVSEGFTSKVLDVLFKQTYINP